MDTKGFDTLLEPIFIVDQDKRVLYCNEAASLMCDISQRKFLRSKPVLDEAFKFKGTLQAFEQLTSVQSATPYQELGFSTETGKLGKVQITVQSFTTDTWLVYFHDVTLEETL